MMKYVPTMKHIISSGTHWALRKRVIRAEESAARQHVFVKLKSFDSIPGAFQLCQCKVPKCNKSIYKRALGCSWYQRITYACLKPVQRVREQVLYPRGCSRENILGECPKLCRGASGCLMPVCHSLVLKTDHSSHIQWVLFLRRNALPWGKSLCHADGFCLQVCSCICLKRGFCSVPFGKCIWNSEIN